MLVRCDRFLVVSGDDKEHLTRDGDVAIQYNRDEEQWKANANGSLDHRAASVERGSLFFAARQE